MTDPETLSALTSAFSAAGIDTPEKVGAFVAIAALQVRLNSQGVELQKLQQQQAAHLAADQTAREAKQAEINATQAQLFALISAQS